MPVLKHKTPCSECPFRRVSAPGWLGASTPQEFLDCVRGEAILPCHQAIDYEAPNWRKQLPAAAVCAGSLVFMVNTAQLPIDPQLRAMRNAVTADRATVFARPDEFLTHHTKFKRPISGRRRARRSTT